MRNHSNKGESDTVKIYMQRPSRERQSTVRERCERRADRRWDREGADRERQENVTINAHGASNCRTIHDLLLSSKAQHRIHSKYQSFEQQHHKEMFFLSVGADGKRFYGLSYFTNIIHRRQQKQASHKLGTYVNQHQTMKDMVFPVYRNLAPCSSV